MKKLLIVAFLLILLPCLMNESSAFAAGIIQVVEGEAFLLRGEAVIKAQKHQMVLAGDRLKTGSSGRMGVVFEDDTIVALGPGSEFAVEEFQFEPREKRVSFISRLIRGVISFVSGAIGRLAPEKVRIETPQATVGLRGTRVLIMVE